MNLLDERERTHGVFNVVAAMSQALKEVLRTGPYAEIPDVQREALEMICVKMARIVCGDHNEVDHWRDVSGYAQLVRNYIKKVPGSSPQQETPDEPDPESINWDYNPRAGKPR